MLDTEKELLKHLLSAFDCILRKISHNKYKQWHMKIKNPEINKPRKI